MPGRLGPRFAIEALFLIALAVGVAYADLASKWIFAVMAGGWLVVALLELSADRIWAAAPPWRRPYYVPSSASRAPVPVAAPPPAPAEPKPEPEPEPEPEPAADPEPEPVAEQEPAPEAEQQPEPEPEAVTMIAAPVSDPERVADESVRPKLEPLEPPRKRGWFRRREREVAAAEEPEIEPPKHVRLLSPSERTDRPSGEVAELFDLPDREERSRQ
jgi:hypothetical protein